MSPAEEIALARADFERAARLEALLCEAAAARAARALELIASRPLKPGARPLDKIAHNSSLVYRQPAIGRPSRRDCR